MSQYLDLYYTSVSDFVYQTSYSDTHLLEYLEGHADCGDGKMIVGIKVKGTEPSDTKLISIFKEMKDYFNAYFGCITSEEAPQPIYRPL